MECPMCEQLYDNSKVAKNLLCGHCYCQICLESIYREKKKIECPQCKHWHDPSIKPSSLSKNFVAMDLASQQLDLKKQLQLCPTHPKIPLKYFCEDDQKNICVECIIEHSGHRFCKLEHSVPLHMERVSSIQKNLQNKMNDIQNQINEFAKVKDNINLDYLKQLETIDKQFEMTFIQLEARRNELQKHYSRSFEQEVNQMEFDQILHTSLLESTQNEYEKLKQTRDILDTVKIVKDDSLVKTIEAFEEEAKQNIKISKELKVAKDSDQKPTIKFTDDLYREITRFGEISQVYRQPQLLFFGDKNKILRFDIETNKWDLQKIPVFHEFHYYASCCTLPTGEILLTGGGLSKSVLLISPLQDFRCINLKSMIYARKEHATIFLNGFVFAIGGYDGNSKEMLSTCEKYDFAQDKWTLVDSLNQQKCAFAATGVENKLIFVFGGYNGRERLNTIERYSYDQNRWTVLSLKFRLAFSNASAIYHEQNKILIVGGGTNLGFSQELNLYDINMMTITPISKMREGRDLRNKMICVDGYCFACGGNNNSCEKYEIEKNVWTTLRSYGDLIFDNLDSWCCGLTFEKQGQHSTHLDKIEMHLVHSQLSSIKFEQEEKNLFSEENNFTFNENNESIYSFNPRLYQ